MPQASSFFLVHVDVIIVIGQALAETADSHAPRARHLREFLNSAPIPAFQALPPQPSRLPPPW